jgi:hypothetical protein
MLNNLTNFFNLIAGRFTKKTLEPTDLIAVGTKDRKYNGGYKPTAIKASDLQAEIGRPYKAYTVSLVQANLDPPVVQVEFENTLEVTATYSRFANGSYYVTFDKPLFNGPDDYVTISQGYYEDAFIPYTFVVVRPVFFNVIQIGSISNGSADDNIIGIVEGSPCILDVRVYN